jgi:type I restriction enzyme S subunit
MSLNSFYNCTLVTFRPNYLNFFYYLLSSPVVVNQFKNLAQGSTVKNLNKELVSKVIVNIPPLATQQKIVAKLDTIFAEIDIAIAAAEANAKNAEALFQSYLTEVFERGSEGWKEIKIKELGKVVTGNTPKTNEPENYGDFISFVKPGDFKGDGSIDLEKQKLSLIGMNKSRVIDEKSALMVCIGATIGKCGYTETKITTNQQVNSITPTEQFNHIFIYLQMLTNDFQNRVNIRSGQATLPIINKSKWESLTLKFPALNDQIKIVNRFNTLRIETDNFRNSKLSKLNELNILKQSILQKAFSGELVKD